MNGTLFASSLLAGFASGGFASTGFASTGFASTGFASSCSGCGCSATLSLTYVLLVLHLVASGCGCSATLSLTYGLHVYARYISKQVLPLVSRLVEPIQTISLVRIARSLGLETVLHSTLQSTLQRTSQPAKLFDFDILNDDVVVRFKYVELHVLIACLDCMS